MIAVDGPAASGKGTIASRLAGALRLSDARLRPALSGVGVRLADSRRRPGRRDRGDGGGPGPGPAELERPSSAPAPPARLASRVAVHPGVRAALRLAARLSLQEPGAVIDGRDIGTVIAPDAPAKLYVTASPEVRADRRWKQLVGQGETVTFDEILADILKRDERDGGRASAP
jgi:cytidylate kinase